MNQDNYCMYSEDLQSFNKILYWIFFSRGYNISQPIAWDNCKWPQWQFNVVKVGYALLAYTHLFLSVLRTHVSPGAPVCVGKPGPFMKLIKTERYFSIYFLQHTVALHIHDRVRVERSLSILRDFFLKIIDDLNFLNRYYVYICMPSISALYQRWNCCNWKLADHTDHLMPFSLIQTACIPRTTTPPPQHTHTHTHRQLNDIYWMPTLTPDFIKKT